MVADECHVGYGETDRKRKGANDFFVNYWARHSAEQPTNLLTLQVSATPFSVLSSCSRIPERRRLLEPCTVDGITYQIGHSVTIVRKSCEDIDVHFTDTSVVPACRVLRNDSSKEWYLQGSCKICVDWETNQSVVEWRPPDDYQSLDNYCASIKERVDDGLKVETDNCFDEFLSCYMQAGGGGDNDENNGENWNAVDARIACLKAEYVLSLMYAVRFRWKPHSEPNMDDREYKTGEYVESHVAEADGQDDPLSSLLDGLLDDLLHDDVMQFRNATVQRKDFLLSVLCRLYSYSDTVPDTRTESILNWTEKPWRQWNLDEFRNLLRPLLVEVVRGKNEGRSPYWGVTDEIIKNLLESGGSHAGHMNGNVCGDLSPAFNPLSLWKHSNILSR